MVSRCATCYRWFVCRCSCCSFQLMHTKIYTWLSVFSLAETLRTYFEKYGPVVEVKIKQDPATQRSRYGVLTYTEYGRDWWPWVVVAQWLEYWRLKPATWVRFPVASRSLFHTPLFSLCIYVVSTSC